MAVQDSELDVRGLIEARQMPRRIFEQLPEAQYDDRLTYLGYWSGTADIVFIAERKDGEFVRVSGDSFWDALVARYGDSDNCCGMGELDLVKMEFRALRTRLPQISLK